MGIWKQPTPPGEPFQCGECESQFRLQDSFVAHVGTHFAFPCACKLWYADKESLQAHALRSHSRRNLHRFLRREREAKFWNNE